MSEYILREQALKAFEYGDADVCESYDDAFCEWGFGRANISDILNSIPTADVAPVRHGRWLHTDWAYHWTSLDECSVCGYHDEKRRNLGGYSYCPNCGAKMDGDAAT